MFMAHRHAPERVGKTAACGAQFIVIVIHAAGVIQVRIPLDAFLYKKGVHRCLPAMISFSNLCHGVAHGGRLLRTCSVYSLGLI